MQNEVITQRYEMYSEEDHVTWTKLCMRQKELRDEDVSEEYLKGLHRLNLDVNRVIKIEEVSSMLESISGWTLVPVTGLIPTKEFLYMLINKKYPINISVRKPYEIDFSEQPDMFHDVYGHLPLLSNEKFTRFLTAYSIIALKYANNERAVELLGRLYWYTYEMGLISEKGVYRAYGGAIITSADELKNVANQAMPKHAFDLDHIFRSPYDSFKLQKEYFVIESFDMLFESLEKLEGKLIDHLLLPERDVVLRNYPLNKYIGRGFNNVIGFLNDIQHKYPDAISLVAGQPDENYFNIEDHLTKFDVFVKYLMDKTGKGRMDVVNGIGQYNKTKGIINDILSQYLLNDENIHLKGDEILVTAGAQEAFAIIVATICDRADDIILTENPSYIGLSSFARISGYNIEGVDADNEGINLKDLKRKIIELNRMGKSVKLLYVIPDYQNPSGACMPIGNRLQLLEMAKRYNFLIIEDTVYNSFTYVQKKNPTLKSLDNNNRVIFVGSFSKSLFPGLRIGVIGADQVVENDQGENVLLIDEMAKVKALFTNNTSTICQAIVGGVLLDLKYSLSEWSRLKFESYKRKRDVIIRALNENIRKFDTKWAKGIEWNEPDGGFFIKMKLPFLIEDHFVLECAKDYKVIFCPMHFFYLNGTGKDEIRLTFSNLSEELIIEGISRLSDFLKSKAMLFQDVATDQLNDNYRLQLL